MSTNSLSKDSELALESPSLRYSPECALIGTELYLFGGRSDSFFPRDEIWIANVSGAVKWIRRLAKGAIPPPCVGARCVAINETIYSYGGAKEENVRLEEIYGLNLKKMEWFEVTTPTYTTKPRQRSYCCLWEIGKRMIMFGGRSEEIPKDCLQSGAQYNGWSHNEIYEFKFIEKDRGFWTDLELSGERPQPREGAATATIDNHRGILHGGNIGLYPFVNDSFMIDLQTKAWIKIHFDEQILPRADHSMCKITILNKTCLFLLGGSRDDKFAFILDFESGRTYSLKTDETLSKRQYHFVFAIEDSTDDITICVCGGNRGSSILSTLSLEKTNADFTRIFSAISSSLFKQQSSSQDRTTDEQLISSRESDLSKERDLRLAAEHQSERKKYALELRNCQAQIQSLTSEISQLRSEKDIALQDNKHLIATLESDLAKERQLHNDTKREFQDSQRQSSSLQNSHLRLEKAEPAIQWQSVENSLKGKQQKLRLSPTQEQLVELSEHLAKDWMFVARRLGFDESEISTISEDNLRARDRAFGMLHAWMTARGSAATVQSLAKALRDEKKLKIAEEILGVRDNNKNEERFYYEKEEKVDKLLSENDSDFATALPQRKESDLLKNKDILEKVDKEIEVNRCDPGVTEQNQSIIFAIVHSFFQSFAPV